MRPPIVTKARPYTHYGRLGGYTIHPAKTGWVVEGWSQAAGSLTDWKGLVSYSHAPRVAHLDTDLAARIAYLAAGPDCRVLRKGARVR